MIDTIKKIKELKIPDSEIWINEAFFGLNQIKNDCKSLDINSNVLEIGCGSGILLSLCSSFFKRSSFEGIEPFNSGFNKLSKFTKILQKEGVNISNVGFEDFVPSKKYDLIYCVNVFEHVNDWKQFIVTVTDWLNPGSKLIILCPNYGFPYESHFKIPIIYNKKITEKLFSKHIASFERKRNALGLWKSLNFITKKELLYFVSQISSLRIIDHYSIIKELIQRFTKDKEFSKRQNIIGKIALLVNNLGLINILLKFPNILPYMKIEIIKRAQLS